MTPSKQEVDQMASFIRTLSATTSEEPVAAPSTRLDEGTITDGQQMKSILSRFYAATDNAVNSLTHEAIHDRELREALITERTPNGSRIGDWEIRLREEGKRKFYDIVQEGGGVCIASDLLLYEAAHGLVRILNSGGRLNSIPAINLLRAEQDYAAALNDAVLYRHYLVKHPKDVRSHVFEAKYSAAKHRAISARNKVVAIFEQR